MFITVLITSLLASSLVIFFAFFPIRTNWFYKSNNDNDDNFEPKEKKRKFFKSTFTKSYEPYFEEIYDDPEL
ncbi:MAG: hypothetical protein FWE01_03230 [Firmicutes bacterium]|nr:hypothetical protein [Bacillota bacterium]